ncbi:MAG: hypothetical protein ACKPEO_22180 [Sphaerospermopsis kisseleviana]
MDIIQPKKGQGKLILGDEEFESVWAALGIANYGPALNQKGFLLIRTSQEMYAFVGDKPFQKFHNNLPVAPITIVQSSSWQWKLPIIKMVTITSNNESVDCQGEILANRVEGLKDAYIYIDGKITSGLLSDCKVNFEFKQLQELPPITNQKFNL